jgi:hypothetical protein
LDRADRFQHRNGTLSWHVIHPSADRPGEGARERDRRRGDRSSALFENRLLVRRKPGSTSPQSRVISLEEKHLQRPLIRFRPGMRWVRESTTQGNALATPTVPSTKCRALSAATQVDRDLLNERCSARLL